MCAHHLEKGKYNCAYIIVLGLGLGILFLILFYGSIFWHDVCGGVVSWIHPHTHPHLLVSMCVCVFSLINNQKCMHSLSPLAGKENCAGGLGAFVCVRGVLVVTRDTHTRHTAPTTHHHHMHQNLHTTDTHTHTHTRTHSPLPTHIHLNTQTKVQWVAVVGSTSLPISGLPPVDGFPALRIGRATPS